MRLKEKKGITLVSLVVTIVILIILAGVSINLVLENNGIINKAQIASTEITKEAATEKMNLKITNAQIETYGKEQRMPTLQELANNFCEDEDFEYVELETKKIGSLNKINVGESKSIFTKLKKYPYEFEIDSSLQLASIDGVNLINSNIKEEYDSFKTKIAQAISEAGIATESDATVDVMINNIEQLPKKSTADANATAEDILEGKTAYVNGELITGVAKNKMQYQMLNNLLNNNIIYSNTYTISGLTIGKYYLIFQTMIDDNAKTGISSGATVIFQSNALKTGGWRGTYAHGRIMLVKATNSTIVIGNSGNSYSTLSKAMVIPIPD